LSADRAPQLKAIVGHQSPSGGAKTLRKPSTFQSLALLVTTLVILTCNIRAQDHALPLQKLKDSATQSEALDWFTEMISAYAAIVVEDEKTEGMAIFKGFKITQSDQCTLTFKNVGMFTQTRVPYSYEATIPIAALDSSSSKVFQHVTDYPNINKAYGTWLVRLSTRNRQEILRMCCRGPSLEAVKGHLVTFKFQEKEDAKKFERGLKQTIKLCRPR
jgi:hypothetical protein